MRSSHEETPPIYSLCEDFTSAIQISNHLDQRVTEAAERFGQYKTELFIEALRLGFEGVEALAATDGRLEDIGEHTRIKYSTEDGFLDSSDKHARSSTFEAEL